MIKINISADSKYPVDRKRIRAVVCELLKDRGVDNEIEVEVSVVGDRKMKELNMKFLRVEGTTDVLSFSQDVRPEGQVGDPKDLVYLGDIVVSWPQAVKQALERNITVDDEIDFLVQHGLLHLLGVHHD